MIIGLTYDLRSAYLAAGFSDDETAEFDREDTIISLETALRQSGHEPIRIGHARDLINRLAAGERWDLVFNIAEGLRGPAREAQIPAREAQIPAILDVYEIPYTFSDPLVMSLSLHKGMTKSVIRGAGLPTPDFHVVRWLSDLAEVRLAYPLFAKPIAEGTGKGVTPASKIASLQQLESTCAELLEKFDQPVLLESYLPGREFTVGIVGEGESTTALGTLEIVLLESAEPEVYSYVNKERCEELVDYRHVPSQDPLVAQCERIACEAWKVLGGRDAGRIDLRCDAAGQPHFLETNPLAGLHPEHSDLPMLCTRIGMPYVKLVECIVNNAAQRLRPRDVRLERLVGAPAFAGRPASFAG
jgi:D-alanine-D-alanine ligase